MTKVVNSGKRGRPKNADKKPYLEEAEYLKRQKTDEARGAAKLLAQYPQSSSHNSAQNLVSIAKK